MTILQLDSHPSAYPFIEESREEDDKADGGAGGHPAIQEPVGKPNGVVAKMDGTTCVDYCKLNAITKMDVYPLQRIEDSLDLLSGQQFFTTLDLASGYWQVQMAEDAREKTAFITHAGLYEFQVMPFGLCNAPAIFQRLMETVLAGLTPDKCLVYLDDILGLGRTTQEHLTNLCSLLQGLQAAGLKLNAKKCSFIQTQGEYLRHIVSCQGVSVYPKRTAAIQEFPMPVVLKSL